MKAPHLPPHLSALLDPSQRLLHLPRTRLINQTALSLATSPGYCSAPPDLECPRLLRVAHISRPHLAHILAIARHPNHNPRYHRRERGKRDGDGGQVMPVRRR